MPKIKVNKGGCKTGRKKEPLGGCKVGKKAQAKPSKPSTAPDLSKMPKGKFVDGKFVKEVPKKKFNVVKKKVKEAPSLGKKLTGLSKEEMNKLSPLELFGMLPVGVAAKKVLNPKVTGVKVGKPTPYNLEDARIIEDFMEAVRNMNGIMDFIYGWSMYDDGNFNEYMNNWFVKQSERLQKFRELGVKFNELINEKKLEKKIKETGIVHDMDILKDVDMDDHGELWYDNMDYEEYYIEDTLGLIYQDNAYFISNRTRSTTKRYISDVINYYIGKKLMKLWGEVKTIIKKNK